MGGAGIGDISCCFPKLLGLERLREIVVKSWSVLFDGGWLTQQYI